VRVRPRGGGVAPCTTSTSVRGAGGADRASPLASTSGAPRRRPPNAGGGATGRAAGRHDSSGGHHPGAVPQPRIGGALRRTPPPVLHSPPTRPEAPPAAGSVWCRARRWVSLATHTTDEVGGPAAPHSAVRRAPAWSWPCPDAVVRASQGARRPTTPGRAPWTRTAQGVAPGGRTLGRGAPPSYQPRPIHTPCMGHAWGVLAAPCLSVVDAGSCIVPCWALAARLEAILGREAV